MVTTIQISKETKDELDSLKFQGESYEDVILDLLDDRNYMTLEKIQELEKIKSDINKGVERTYLMDEIKREHNL